MEDGQCTAVVFGPRGEAFEAAADALVEGEPELLMPGFIHQPVGVAVIADDARRLEAFHGDELTGLGEALFEVGMRILQQGAVQALLPALESALRARLDAAGLGNNVRIETADALSWDTERRFDAICVTAAVDTIPSRFTQWLRPGGRLFVIRGQSPVMEAVLVKADGSTESLFETDIDYLRGAAPAPQFQL